MTKTLKWLLVAWGLLMMAGVFIDAQAKGKSFESTIGLLAVPVLLISFLFFLGTHEKAALTLPPDLQAKQRSCVNRHNLHVLYLFLCLVPFLVLGLWVARFSTAGCFALLIGALIVEFYVAAVPMRRADDRYSQKIGFVCPHCGEPLYYASDSIDRSRLLTRGECPSCDLSVMANAEPKL